MAAAAAGSGQELALTLLCGGPPTGAEIEWISMFPGEKETLFPPLTFLKPMFSQRIKGLNQGLVITLKPSFPS
jgi:hypothetical protein